MLGVVLLATITLVHSARQHCTAALQLDATVGQEGFPLAGGRPPSFGRAKYRGLEPLPNCYATDIQQTEFLSSPDRISD